jgi:hypothetical protein
MRKPTCAADGAPLAGESNTVEAVMTNVVTLPTAAAEPLPKRRWHGRYPKGVTPISGKRLRRLAEQRDSKVHRAEPGKVSYTTDEALLQLYHRAVRGELAGVVLFWEDAAGKRTATLCGEFEADRVRALEAAGDLYEILEGLNC